MTPPASLSLSTATAADFEPARGETFRLVGRDASFDLRLDEVRPLGFTTRAGGAFSLTFVGTSGPCLPQAIYPLTNERLGPLEIFLVPIGPVDGGNAYEAVFS